MNHLQNPFYQPPRTFSTTSVILVIISFFLFFQCQSDLAPKTYLTVEDWAEKYIADHPEVDDYLASDFCEMALAGFFKNSISGNTESLDSIMYYSDVLTDIYNAQDLVQLAEELKEQLAQYYEDFEIQGNDVTFYKFADRLLVLSVPFVEKEHTIYQRTAECEYSNSYPFLYEEGCSETIMSATELTTRFDNSNSDGCHINEAFPTPESGPTSWNKIYLYRTIPNEHSNKSIYTSDCGDVNDCFARIENANFTAINPISCYLGSNKAYCKALELPNTQSAYRLMIFDIDLEICTPGIIMNKYQEYLADLAKAVRAKYLYGLDPSWTIHKALLRPTSDDESQLKAHEAVIQYVKWGYNPNIGHGE